MSFPAFFTLFTIAFVSLNILALGGAVALLRGRGHHSAWAISLLLSTMPSLAGPLLLIDLGLRVLASQGADTASIPSPSNITLLLCWVWTILVGPVLFITAVVHHAKATPLKVYLLQLAQVAAWAWSGLMLFAFI
jgi:hypothetical protein